MDTSGYYSRICHGFTENHSSAASELALENNQSFNEPRSGGNEPPCDFLCQFFDPEPILNRPTMKISFAYEMYLIKAPTNWDARASFE